MMLLAVASLQAQITVGTGLYLTELNPMEDAEFGRAIVVADFNCDGLDDVAVGAPHHDLNVNGQPVTDAGIVEVWLGFGTGIFFHQLISQGSYGGSRESGDGFGQVLAVGNFNGDFSVEGDPCMDLAVGVPFEDIGTVSNAGAVITFLGSGTVATPSINLGSVQIWHQNVSALGESAGAHERFGASLAVGDFNGDGFDDLAIGTPREEVVALGSAGMVHVLAGSAEGLAAAPTPEWAGALRRDLNSVLGAPGEADQFGFALASCDIDGDSFDDLVIGVPGDDTATHDDEGAIQTFFGHAAPGLDLTRQSLEPNPYFGSGGRLGESLVGGNFDAQLDGCEIAASARLDLDRGGSVALFKPRADDPATSYDRLTENDFPGETLSANEFFGSALAIIDTSLDGVDELLIGAPFDSLFENNDGVVFWHPFDGRTPASYRLAELEVTPGTSVEEARLGEVIASGDIIDDGQPELLLGLPRWPGSAPNPLGLPEGTGVVLIVGSHQPLFADGFESGSTSGWSATTAR